MSDNRPTLPLPYGQGLDVASGVAVAQPSRFEDLRNVVLFDGKAQVRPGHLLTGRMTDGQNNAFGKVFQVDISTGPTFVDETADANSAGNGDWTIFPAGEAIGDYVALGFARKYAHVIFDYLNGTAGVAGVVVWEYWNGVAWAALTGVTDETNGFTAAVADGRDLLFTVPHDWATTSLNGSDQLYFIRARITTVFTTNPVFDQGFIADADVDSVIGIHALRREQQAMVAGYVASTRKAHVARFTGAGALAQYLAEWFTAHAESATPRPILADIYNKVFLAHDEVIYARRAMTAYVQDDVLYGLGPLNPDASPNGDVDLSTDLDGDGENDQIKFRGIVQHLNYVFGWGYGTGTDPDRPEIVRVCKPGQPLHWVGDHYFQAGSPGIPVVDCGPAGSVLAVFKESQIFDIHGYDKSTFGIRLADERFGQAAARLGVTVDKTRYFWSLEGPRLTVGGPSVDIAVPLDLDAPRPEDLVDAGEVEDGFAHYIPNLRVILWVFGRRIYCLSLRNPNLPRWSYWELPHPAFCAGTIWSGGATGSGTAPSAYVSGLSGVAGP